MAIFSNKIVDVYYTDENLTNVTILYNYEKDGETLVGEYHLLVDETEEQFQHLLREMSYADIEASTVERNLAHKREFDSIVEIEVKKIVEERELQQTEKEDIKTGKDLFEFIFEYDSDKDADELFKCKLYLFTLDMVKNTATYNIDSTNATAPIDVLDVFIRETVGTETTDLPLTRLSRAEYSHITTKSSTGNPKQFFINTQTTPTTQQKQRKQQANCSYGTSKTIR